jgi:hypothetical protein
MTERATKRTEAEAKAAWDAERAYLREVEPGWVMPAWSRAPAWRRMPYYWPDQCGEHQPREVADE